MNNPVADAPPTIDAPPPPPPSLPPLVAASPPVVLPKTPKRFLLVINAGPTTVPVARHLGEDVDVLAIKWHRDSKIDVASAMTWVERNPIRNRKFQSVVAALGGNFDVPYTAVGIVDDDLVPKGCTWSDIFKLGVGAGYEVFQPALTPESYNAHPILRREPTTLHRVVDFVEVMTPFLSRKALLACGPLFNDAGPWAWGLEVLWGNRYRCGVLDSTPVAHAVRPMGAWAAAPESRAIGDNGTALATFETFKRRHNLLPLQKKTRARVLESVAYDVTFWDTVGGAYDGAGSNPNQTGGSEWATIKVARMLAAYGLRVLSLTNGGPRGRWDGVDYDSVARAGQVNTDALVIQRYSEIPQGRWNRLFFALHDVYGVNASANLLARIDSLFRAGSAEALCVGAWQCRGLPPTWRARTIAVPYPPLPMDVAKIPGRYVFPPAFTWKGMKETLDAWGRLHREGEELTLVMPGYGGSPPRPLPPGVRLGSSIVQAFAESEGVFHVNPFAECLPAIFIAEKLGCRIHALSLHPQGLCGMRDAVNSPLLTTDPMKFERDFLYWSQQPWEVKARLMAARRPPYAPPVDFSEGRCLDIWLEALGLR